MKLLEAKISSLQRRSESLTKEIGQWLNYAEPDHPLEKNLSQLQALEIFMSQMIYRLKSDFSSLLSSYNTEPIDVEAVLDQVRNVETGITKADANWSYFRSKLEQRFIPQFTEALFVVDLVAYDCYTILMNNARSQGIINKLGLRDYPLAYLLTKYVPVTWPRSMRIATLDQSMLPVPIIGIPWNQVANPWELLSLHHEVSHDIDADLNMPSEELGQSLKQVLIGERRSLEYANEWEGWMREVFADFLAILLAGPSFVACLADFLTLPRETVCNYTPHASHPSSYLRILLNCALVGTISTSNDINSYVDRIRRRWKEIYGEPIQELAPFIDDFDLVIQTVLLTKLRAFQDEQGELHAFRELIEFKDGEFANQMQASQHFLTGTNISESIPIRHIIGAAYMAAEERIKLSTFLDEKLAAALSDHVSRTIKEKAPPGQLALRTRRSRKYLQELANACFDSPAVMIGEFDDQTLL